MMRYLIKCKAVEEALSPVTDTTAYGWTREDVHDRNIPAKTKRF